MGAYLQKVRGLELLQMKAEFFKDENGYIWFFYAKEICIRKSRIEGTAEAILT